MIASVCAVPSPQTEREDTVTFWHQHLTLTDWNFTTEPGVVSRLLLRASFFWGLSCFAVSRLVNRHLSALVTEARSAGMQLEDLTIELAAHANCAALSFWSADDLHSLLEAAAAEASPQAVAEWKHIEPMGRA